MTNAPDSNALPTIALLFNDRKGPELMREHVEREHAFCRFATWQDVDEEGRSAYVFAVWSETASAEEIWGYTPRLPDYLRARKYPPTRAAARAGGVDQSAAHEHAAVDWPAAAPGPTAPGVQPDAAAPSLVDYVEGP